MSCVDIHRPFIQWLIVKSIGCLRQSLCLFFISELLKHNSEQVREEIIIGSGWHCLIPVKFLIEFVQKGYDTIVEN
jgi:hypothetical protein